MRKMGLFQLLMIEAKKRYQYLISDNTKFLQNRFRRSYSICGVFKSYMNSMLHLSQKSRTTLIGTATNGNEKSHGLSK